MHLVRKDWAQLLLVHGPFHFLPQIREAVATAATVRQWSTVLNGMGYDFEEFKKEMDSAK